MLKPYHLGVVILAVLTFTGAACSRPPITYSEPVAVDKLNQLAAEEVEESADSADNFETVQTVNKEITAVEPEAPFEMPTAHRITVLPVPFMVQAPHANWEMPYKEACEEASIIMVVEYLSGRKTLQTPADEADELILELIDWQERKGYSVDLTVAEVVKVLSERYQITAQVRPYEAEIVRRELQAGRPVIVPAAGRRLGNPYFTAPGPLYHMLVIKGYEGDEFIVNDPGTKRGESYRYHSSVLANAVHDWNGGEVEQGNKVMIIIKQVE